MKVEFYLVDNRGLRGIEWKAADPNELVEIAEKLGLKKQVKKLGYCWKWIDGDLIDCGDYEIKWDHLPLGNPRLFFERRWTFEKDE